jgi:hypothetical protein
MDDRYKRISQMPGGIPLLCYLRNLRGSALCPESSSATRRILTVDIHSYIKNTSKINQYIQLLRIVQFSSYGSGRRGWKSLGMIRNKVAALFP